MKATKKWRITVADVVTRVSGYYRCKQCRAPLFGTHKMSCMYRRDAEAEVNAALAAAEARGREQGAAEERERIAKECERRALEAEDAKGKPGLSGTRSADCVAGAMHALRRLAAWIRNGKVSENV